MSSIAAHITLKPTTSTLFAPFLYFSLLFWDTRRDPIIWSGIVPGFYPAYFALFFGGFVALIAAYYARSVPVPKGPLRMRFVALAFLHLGVLSWMGSVATLGVLPEGNSIALFVWSYYLGLPLGALFFSLGVIRWSPRVEAAWVRLRLWPMVGLFGLELIFFGWVTAVPHLFAPLINTSLFQLGQIGLATAAILLYLWAAFRVWNDFWVEGALFSQRLSLALLLFAFAQFGLVLVRPGTAIWPLHYGLFLAALLVSVWAILSTLRANNTLQVSRYFAITGSISITGFSLILAELFVNLFNLQASRPLVAAIMLLQGLVNFLLLYAIVAYLDRLIQKRTAAYRREQRLRTDLTQMIVHDLKSPLTVVHSSIGMLLKGHLGGLGPNQMRVLQRAEASNKHILEMIETLLDVERLEAGVATLQREEIQSVAWLRTCLSDWEMVAEARGAAVRVSISHDLPPVWGDPELLQRVLDNLLSNALNFTPETESIEVTAFAQEGNLIIQVADHGPGVPECERERIFEKFARVEGGQRRGSGLGLAFCRMVAEAHQGCISVANHPEGGALFKLSLPLSMPDAPPGMDQSRPHLLLSGR